MNQAYFINFIILYYRRGDTPLSNVPVYYNGSRFWYEIYDDVLYFIDCVERLHR